MHLVGLLSSYFGATILQIILLGICKFSKEKGQRNYRLSGLLVPGSDAAAASECLGRQPEQHRWPLHTCKAGQCGPSGSSAHAGRTATRVRASSWGTSARGAEEASRACGAHREGEATADRELYHQVCEVMWWRAIGNEMPRKILLARWCVTHCSYLICFNVPHRLTCNVIALFGSQLCFCQQVKHFRLTERSVTKNLFCKGSTELGAFFYLKIVLHWKLGGIPSPKNRRWLHLRKIFEDGEEEVAEDCRIGGFIICVHGLHYHWVDLRKKAEIGLTCVSHGEHLYGVFVLKAPKGRIHLSETVGNGRIMIVWWSFVLQSSINARKKGGSCIVRIYLLWMYEHIDKYLVADVTNIRISLLSMNSIICCLTCMVPNYFHLKIL